ncbi:hypothetical protein FLJC2902T_01690 [Flavobacterium limnosediminis JC2902]|uniref:HTH araC/xylS-type domain-containing protein n=1 Tax=Flavobacterium limnosediminis JC2902 TaxID=1341181 RepID=V6SSU0_9FLAO|nr:hypothetical protein FLJC2902T_01690 [Flavobacterium limnosediminis JC2902]
MLSQDKSVLSNEEYLTLQDKTRAYFNSNKDSSFFYATKIEKSDNAIHKAFSSGAKGYLYAMKGDFTNAEKYYKNAVKFIKNAPKSYSKTQNESYIYNYGGLIDWLNGKFPNALDNYFAAKKLSESINDIVQIVKINNNIALIDGDAGNYSKAIATTKESDRIIEANSHLFSESQYNINKSNVNINLGVYYESLFLKNITKTHLCDSAFYYFNKTLKYSDDIMENKLKAQKEMGIIYFLKNRIVEAEKAYVSVLTQAKSANFEKEYCNANYNLGFLKYRAKQFEAALVYFQKVDSIYKSSGSNYIEYIHSNYYLAKIYDTLGEPEKALEYSRIYLDNFEKNEFKNYQNVLDVNYKIGNQDLEKEMNTIQKEHKNEVFFKNSMIGFFTFLFITLSVLFIINYKRRKAAEQKITTILKEHELNDAAQNHKSLISSIAVLNEADKVTREVSSISLDNEKELLQKLKSLEEKMFYLRPEFTQQEVAKKIKTNTTYLSYVVNKNYNKSFSVYYNELRINYAVNEIINNLKYREYTTQAIAESVGFKNADSFASSFKKKTGVTPYQFINEIKKRELC